MSETAGGERSGGRHTGLLDRFLGIIRAPRDTFAVVIAEPASLDMVILVSLVAATCTGWFFSTEVGQLAYLDASEATGRLGEEQLQAVERMLPSLGYASGVGLLVAVPLAMTVLAGVLFAVFRGRRGGEALFKQVFAVVAHSGAVLVLQQLLVTPLNYARESMSSPTNLSVFLPMLEEGTFLARFLGIIDLFYVWWFVVLAIGLGVLYRRRTQPIALTLLAVYVGVAVTVAGVMSSLGRS
jgi:hypothetical protein